ncbi:hypothetical protein I2I11_05740 [Pontibacter sp. 172403-2]|uniref:hypothetical protein n=1 Tax=Pontibacter rufus TaxID=2791028 RepID=UPI0018B01594|nr:hypothetical protein [Pontibacter sp. 172403-2]MBF9252782.1 hypothetical protein [Pontibacter sp. 172403-2]
MAAENQVLRITYEAFSRFSNSLTRCLTLEAVAACFRVNLKYLFNFHTFRASYNRGDTYLHLQITATGAEITEQRTPGYMAFEKLLLERQIPMHWSDLQELNLPRHYTLPPEEQGELWGWLIQNDAERHIVVSVLAGRSRIFTRKDITFLKLVAESLEAKLFELCLLQELDENNKQLQRAFDTIHEKNTEISSIMAYQQEVITDRTREIAAKNARLLEVSVLNAHTVREPLSRILGLVNLLEMRQWSLEEIKEQILPRLRLSAQDLDGALQEVIEMSTADLIKLKA